MRTGLLVALALLCSATPTPAAGAGTEGLRQEAEQLRTLALRIGQGRVAREEIGAEATRALAHAREAARADGVPDSAVAFIAGERRHVAREPTAAVADGILRRTATRLDALAAIETLDGGKVSGTETYPLVHAALEAELATGLYGTTDNSAWGRLSLAIGQFVQSFIDRLIGSDAVQVLERISFYFTFVVLLVALAVLGWLGLTRYRRRPGAQPGSVSAVVETRRMSDPEVFRTQAAGHAAAGRFRDAVRALFLMLLAELETRDLVVSDRTRTNAEYAQQLRRRVGAGPLLRGFQTLSHSFNRAWYGRRPCDADDYSAFSERVTATLALVADRG